MTMLKNNLSMDKYTDAMLKLLSFQLKKTRSEIVRELIRERAEKEDGLVKKYLEIISYNHDN